MKLLADESVERQVIEQLRQDGFDVTYIAEIEPSISDETVFKLANEKKCLLITSDKDFGELVFKADKLNLSGVVLLRLAGLSAESKIQTISSAFQSNISAFSKAFSVIEPGRVRIRAKIDRK